MKSIFASAALLLLMSCASAGGPGVQKQRLLLTLWTTTPEDSFSGPDLDVYDRGLVVFSQKADEVAAIADAETNGAFHKLVRDPAWRKLLSDLETKDYGDGFGQAGLHIQYETGATFVPFEKIPEELRIHLRQIDDLFARVFDTAYPVRLAEPREMASSAGPAASKQRLFLSLYFSASGAGMFGPHLRVYDGGLLILSQDNDELVAAADAETLAAFQKIVRDPQWQHLISKLASTHDVETMPEGDFSLAIRSESGDAPLWARFPVDDMPEELRPYLKRVDDVFQQTFGSKYPFYLSSVRTQ
ncbi:MAG TPA: hypothetical protein VGX68_28490 [Thermoanaerobaculia bacterium]|jgi:hypothetical protein|nr:hypothetical protein [Thermoanaerobaculia bacterium]